jgi:hydroxymethylpyrimidine/phosphomethylpyrimidine kinase
MLTDVLAIAGEPAAYWQRLSGPRIASRNVHGTGCTLSSAIAAQLAQGHTLEEAVQAGHGYIRGAIEAGAAVVTGQGHGPLNHGYAPLPMRVLAG